MGWVVVVGGCYPIHLQVCLSGRLLAIGKNEVTAAAAQERRGGRLA